MRQIAQIINRIKVLLHPSKGIIIKGRYVHIRRDSGELYYIMINSYHEKDYPNSDRFIPEDRNIIINQIYKKKLREGQFVYIELVHYLNARENTHGSCGYKYQMQNGNLKFIKKINIYD